MTSMIHVKGIIESRTAKWDNKTKHMRDQHSAHPHEKRIIQVVVIPRAVKPMDLSN